MSEELAKLANSINSLSAKISSMEATVNTPPNERFSISVASGTAENSKPSLGLVRGASRFQQAMSVFGGTIVAACFLGLSRGIEDETKIVAGLTQLDLLVHVATRIALGLALLGIAALATQLLYDKLSRKANARKTRRFTFWIFVPTFLGLLAYLAASIPFFVHLTGQQCGPHSQLCWLC